MATKSALKLFREGKITKQQFDAQIAQTRQEKGVAPDVKLPTTDKTVKASEVGITKGLDKAAELQKKRQRCIANGGTFNENTGLCEFKRKTESDIAKEESDIAEKKQFAPKTPTEKTREKFEKTEERLEEDIFSAQQKLDIQEEEALRAETEAKEVRKGSIAAAKGAFAESPEGVKTSTAQELAKGFERGINIRTQAQLNQVRGLRQQIADKRIAFERAREDVDEAKTNALLDDIADIEDELALQEEAFNEQEAELTADLLERFGNLGGQVETMTTDQLTSFFAGSSVSLGEALLLQQKAIADQEVLDTDSDEAKLRVEKLQKELDKIGVTDVQKAIEGSQALEDALTSGEISQDTFDALSVKLGFAEKELTSLQKAQTRKAEAEAEKIEKKNLKKDKSSASNGSSKVNPIDITPNFDFGTGEAGQSVTDSEGNVVATISSPFGADHSKISGETTHNAVDMVFEDGNALSLTDGVVVNKGFDSAYGGFIQIEDAVTGDTVQYGHLNFDDLKDYDIGKTFKSGDFLAKQETDPSLWGQSTGPHTDYRFAGVNTEGNENQTVHEYGIAILDGRMNISNVSGEDAEETASLRSDVTKFVNKKLKEGYKSNYPVLTETQLKLVDTISDDINKDKETSDIKIIKGGYNTVTAIYGSQDKIDAGTGFDDVAAINSFQRIIDPGVSVREGDITILQSSVPMLERVDPDFRWSAFTKGDKLPIDTRNSLVRVAREIYNRKAEVYNEGAGARFKERAEASNIPFSLVGDEFPIYGTESGTPLDDIVTGYDNEIESLSQELAEIDRQLSEEATSEGSTVSPTGQQKIKLNQ